MPKDPRKMKISLKNPYWMVSRQSWAYELTRWPDGTVGDGCMANMPDYKTHFANVRSSSFTVTDRLL